MKNERLLIDGYLYNDYENSYILNKSKYDLLNMFCEKISKINSYIEKFIKEKMDNKLLKDKLAEFKNEKNFHNLFSLLLTKIDVSFNENNIMLNKILDQIKKFKDSFKSYFKKYDEFVNSQKKFVNKLNEIENYKNNFFIASNNAEKGTYEFLKKKVFNIKSKNQNEFQEKENLKNLAKIELDKYKEKIKEGNNELEFFNEMQKEIFQSEKGLEIKYNEVYSDCLMIYLEHQISINEQGTIEEIKEKILNLNEKSNTKQLKHFLENYIQKDEIDFVQYRTHIQFDKCQDALELSAVFMTYNEMSEYIGKYKDNDFLDETQKLELSRKINKILHLNEKITEQDSEVLFDIVKNNMGQIVFINLLSLLRSNGFYEKSKNFILVIAKTLNIILETAEKEKNYEKAKNCIILSQTFFYYDLNKKKNYIFEFIKENKWIKSPEFWRAFINVMLEKEFEKAHILKKYNLNDILLTQLLPFINNMKELGIDIRIIIKIMDEFLLKYNYLSKESYNVLFSILDNNPKQIEKYRKELKDNPNLENELYNNDQKNDNDDNKANDNDENKINNNVNKENNNDIKINNNNDENKDNGNKDINKVNKQVNEINNNNNIINNDKDNEKNKDINKNNDKIINEDNEKNNKDKDINNKANENKDNNINENNHYNNKGNEDKDNENNIDNNNNNINKDNEKKIEEVKEQKEN